MCQVLVAAAKVDEVAGRWHLLCACVRGRSASAPSCLLVSTGCGGGAGSSSAARAPQTMASMSILLTSACICATLLLHSAPALSASSPTCTHELTDDVCSSVNDAPLHSSARSVLSIERSSVRLLIFES